MINSLKESTDEKPLAKKFADLFLLEGITLENEIVSLRYDISLKPRSTDRDFWTLVPKEKYYHLTVLQTIAFLLCFNVLMRVSVLVFKTNDVEVQLRLN